MATTAADVPSLYDLVITDGTDTYGYVLHAGWTGGESANSPEKAVHSYSPVFIPRTNIEGNYGDDSEDFFMTYSQKDWSLGEGQKHQGRSDDARRQYWRGSSADILIPGQVTIRPLVDVLDFSAGAPEAMCYIARESAIAVGAATNLYTVVAAGTITDEGAHGLGAAPARWGMTSDGADLYMTTEEAGTVGVRKWDGTAFTTFSATGSSALEYLNNTLFGLDKDGILRKYSTAGVASTIHTWQGADGVAISLGTKNRIRAFGGKLLVLLQPNGPQTAELWIYDGVGVSLLNRYSANFMPHGFEVLNGAAFVSGYLKQSSGFKPVIYYYANGSVGKLWEADEVGTSTGGPDLASFDEKLVFTDSTTERIMIYNPDSGGVSGLGGYTVAEDTDQMIAAADSFLVATHGGGTGFQAPTLVQSAGAAHNGAASPQTVSWPAPTTAGNTLLLAVHIVDTGGGTPTLTTPSGWTLVGTETTGDNRISLYKIVAAASRSGAQSVAWTTGTSSVMLQLFEYSGTGIEDVAAAGDTGISAATFSTSATLTTTQNDELWFAIGGWLNSSRTIDFSSISDSFSLIREEEGASISLAAVHKNVTATGTASTVFTLTGTALVWLGLVATFKAKAVGEGYLYPDSTKAAGATVTSSRLDFDSSLEKIFRGIKVDFDDADDGDGGTVDISYRVNDLDGDYTTLQADATSGTEYAIGSVGSAITGRSISVRVTLNKGTSTDGPVLKRVYVRAAPKIEQRHRGLYRLDCTAPIAGDTYTQDHTGAAISRNGEAMVGELREFAGSGEILTITDPLHTYTGTIERLDIAQTRANNDPGYVVTLVAREV